FRATAPQTAASAVSPPGLGDVQSTNEERGREWLAVPGGLPVVRTAVVRRRTRLTWAARLRGRLVALGLDLLELALESIIGVRLRADVPVARLRDRADELVQLELCRLRIAVLGVLDQEHHEEGHDRST